jgi:SAM-dependent methyltransferase
MSATSSDEYAAIAECYDSVPLYAGRPDVAFYVDRALRSGGPVLEVGCGTARILVPSARAGVDILGIDESPSMLRICQRRLSAEPELVRSHATLMACDIRHFESPRRFALATIPFRPFQHLLMVDDQLACLARIRHHLRPGGQLVFDIFSSSLDILANVPVGEEFGDEPRVHDERWSTRAQKEPDRRSRSLHPGDAARAHLLCHPRRGAH